MPKLNYTHKWNDKILYQIYVRSFKDSNGDGNGDILGIIEKLDYLVDLGINAIWLTPFFPSPQKDNGYDISDYLDIDPRFGTLNDFEKLTSEAHQRGIKIIIDLVFNHTSDQHPWFLESKMSKDNPKRDWYIWRDPKPDGSVPNNWVSVFEGTAWEYDENTKQYYYHSFLKEQPDLNWENPEVRKEIESIIRFWLEKGVDGFRLDAINYISKHANYEDEPRDINPVSQLEYDQLQHIYSKDQDKLFEFLNELGEIRKDYPDLIFITEAYPQLRGVAAIAEYKKYIKKLDNSLFAPFNFECIFLEYNATEFKNFIDRYLDILKTESLPIFVLGNHDRSRIISRVGYPGAQILAIMQMTLPGMPVIYYGEEIGMKDYDIPKDKIQDTYELYAPGFGRDPERTPMQWNRDKFAGFSTVIPWLPVADNSIDINVESELNDNTSMLNLYRKLLRLRKDLPELSSGEFKFLETSNNVLAYSRKLEKSEVVVILNFSNAEQILNLDYKKSSVLIDNQKLDISYDINISVLKLEPNQGIVCLVVN